MSGLLYTIGLVDLMSRPARQAGAAVSALSRDLSRGKADLAGFQQQLGRARALGDVSGYKHYSAAVDGARRSVYALQQQVEALGPAHAAATSGAGGLLAAIRPWALALSAASEAGTALIHTVEHLTVSLFRAANEEKSFERSSRAAFSALGGSDEAGRQTFDLLDGLSRKLPQSRAQLADWTKTLQAAGITDLGVLRSGLLGLASSNAIMGDAGSGKLLETIRKIQGAVETGRGLKLDPNRGIAQLAKTGADIRDVAKLYDGGRMSVQQLSSALKAGTVDAGKFGTALLEAINRKGRGPLAAMWQDLTVIQRKGEELGSRLLSNVDIKPVTRSLWEFVGLFDQGTASGKEMARQVRSGVNGIAKTFGELTHIATLSLIKIETWAVRLETALLPVARILTYITRAMDTSSVRLALGALSLGTFDATGAAAASSKARPTTPAAAHGAKVYNEKVFDAAVRIHKQLEAGASRESMMEAGQSLSDALATGITLGLISPKDANRLRDAAFALGKTTAAHVSAGAGVHSPSRLTMATGRQVGAGLAIGMRESARDVERAAAQLGGRAAVNVDRAAAFSRGGDSARGQSRGGRTVHIDRVEVQIAASNGVTDATTLTATALAIVLEREALMSGV